MASIRKPKATPNQELRTCKKCGESKPLTEFYTRTYRSKKNPKQLNRFHECKACTIIRTRTNYYGPTYAEIRELENGKERHRRTLVKAVVLCKYSGGTPRCACCGETELGFLQLDHINNDGAEHRKRIIGCQTAAGHQTYRWLIKHGFPAGFQVLCANCNHGKRMNKGICPHQLRLNDHPATGVEPSGSKRSAAHWAEDMVCSVAKVTAACRFLQDLRTLVNRYKVLGLHEELKAGLELATQD